MTERQLWATLLTVALVLLRGGPAGAQGEPVEPPPASALVVAPVNTAGVDPAVAITGLHRDPGAEPGDPLIVVRLVDGIGPLGDGGRVSVYTGNPNGTQVRSSMLFENGEPTGLVEEGDGVIWAPAGAGEVSVTDDGQARLRIEGIGSSDLLWAEASNGVTTRTTPLFPLASVIGTGDPGVLRPAAVAVVENPDGSRGEAVQLEGTPSVSVANQAIVVSSAQGPPTEILGSPVVTVVDTLRVVPDAQAEGSAPYFVSIDANSGEVGYWNGTADGLPVPIDDQPADWLAEPFEAAGDGYTVSLDRVGLLDTAGVADDSTSLGVARTITLEDGRILTADGAVAPLSWFDAALPAESGGGAGPTDPPADDPVETPPPTATVGPIDEGLDGPAVGVIVAAVVVAVLLAVAAVWTARRNRRAATDADAALGAMAKVVEKGSDEKRAARSKAVPAPSDREESESDDDVTGVVGVAGARAAANRQAKARAANEQADGGPPIDDETGRSALRAAMRRRVEDAEEGTTEPEGGSSADVPSLPTRDTGAELGRGAEESPSVRGSAEPEGTERAEPGPEEASPAAEAEKAAPGAEDTAEETAASEGAEDAAASEGGEDAAVSEGGEATAEADASGQDVAGSKGEAPADVGGSESESEESESDPRQVRPDDALAALNDLIDDLPLPGDD